eukprot:TRINITY_DN19674_c0_g2_i1.p1 TRINITY_DN19674_c0_g2~~TRINITY_DN19674_c0_g2_i1.p1  ORF type:complete len:357 (+),score=30.51 TRINITY_DN19674_c0_g2_i1:218-1288(+)
MADTGSDDGLYFGEPDAEESSLTAFHCEDWNSWSMASGARMPGQLALSESAVVASPKVRDWPSSASAGMAQGSPYPAVAGHESRVIVPLSEMPGVCEARFCAAAAAAAAAPSGADQSHGFSDPYALTDARSCTKSSTSSVSSSHACATSSGQGSLQSVQSEDPVLPHGWSVAFVHGHARSSAADRREVHEFLVAIGLPVSWVFGSAPIFSRWLFKRARGPHVTPRCILIVGWREARPVAEVLVAVASGQLNRLPVDPKRGDLQPVTDEHGKPFEDFGGLVQTCISDVILLVAESRRKDIVINACRRLLAPICAMHTAYDQQRVIQLTDELMSRPDPGVRDSLWPRPAAASCHLISL